MKANKSEKESVPEIMARISHADLLSYYFNIDTLPQLINSPLRKDDHPSFFLYSPDGTKVLYKDYATGDSGDIYSLLQRQKGITFSQLMHKIATDIKSDKSSTIHNSVSKGKPFAPRSSADIQVKIRDWKPYDLKYWESYGITLPWLKLAEVYPISHKIIYKDNQRYVFPAAKYAYVFVERKEGVVSLKIYQPLVTNKRFKWNTSNNGSVVGLWTKVPEHGDRLVICSSLKDALCLWANVGIPAIYVQSETTGLSTTAQEVLRKRFKRIFICFDNDAPGLRDGEKLAEETGFQNIVLPAFKEGKDLSDLYKMKGKQEFINIVKPLFV